MTEAEWLSSDDPAAMLTFLRGGVQKKAAHNWGPPSARKLRLFACACCLVPMGTRAALLREIFGNPFRPVSFEETVPLTAEQQKAADEDCDGHGPFPEVRPARWLTPTVLSLAQSIYDERAFDRMPILGDALEESGCTEESVLRHCRGEEEVIEACADVAAYIEVKVWRPLRGPHCRGCWVVDLILGKE